MASWGLSFVTATRLLMRENQEIVVPKIVGFPFIEAQRMMEQRKLNIKIEKMEETAEFPENTVISQSVEPGTIVKEDRTILLRVAKPMERMEVPNLIGKDLLQAKIMVEKQNLKLVNVALACSKKIKTGKVISQSPQSDEVVTNRDIQLLVSSGPCQNQYVMRNLKDHRVDAAIKREFSEREIDLKLFSSSQTRENLTKAKVINQEPPAGSIIKSGESVVLTLE